MRQEDGDILKTKGEPMAMNDNNISEMPEWIRIPESSNVVKMEPGKPRRGNKAEKSEKAGEEDKEDKEDARPKLPLPQVQYALLDWMVGSRDLGVTFPATFRTTEIDRTKGVYTLLEIDKDNLASEVHQKVLKDAILKLMARFKGDNIDYCLPLEKLRSLAETFTETKHARQIPPPPVFTFEKDKHKIAFNRVPNPNMELRCFYGTDEFRYWAPLYSDFIDRCSEPLAVRQFFGTLLHPEYRGKQSLHLYGNSNAGKSTFIELFLQTLCGKRGYEPVDFEGVDKFRLDGWSGKLALYADEINDEYYHTREYKRITNCTEQRVNIKNIPAHKQLITARLIATSNPCPSLPADNAVTNRIVLSIVEPLKKENNDKEALKRQLTNEMPYILADMEYAFSLLRGGSIRVSDDCHEEALSIHAAPLQELFDRYFIADPAGRIPVAEFKQIIVRKGEKINYQAMREFIRQKYSAQLNFRSGNVVYVTKIRLKPGVML